MQRSRRRKTEKCFDHGRDYGYFCLVQKIFKASEFKTHCLQLMDEVKRTGETIVITKNGSPVAQLGPLVSRPPSLIGLHQNKLKLLDDLIEPIGEVWEAERVGP